MGLAEGNRRAARRRRRRRQVACSRVGAWSGHGRLGAALRVVATLLRAGEPAVPTAPRAQRLLHLRPAPPGPCIRTRRACSGSARTCAPPAGWCLWHLYLGVGPRGRAPHRSLLGGDSAASVVPEERGLDQDRALTPFTDGDTEAREKKKAGRVGRGERLTLPLGLPFLWAQPSWVVMADGSEWAGGLQACKGGVSTSV